jgi:glycogen operon protein
MTQKDWQNAGARALGVFLNGREIPTRDEHGERIEDDSYLLLFNAHFEPVTFTLPTRRFGARWELELATCELPEGTSLAARTEVPLDDHAVVLLRRV